MPAADASSRNRWGTTVSAFICFAAIVATRYTTSPWCVGSVAWLMYSNSGEYLANRINSNVVEHVACHNGKGRCNLVKHDPEKCNKTRQSSRETHLEHTILFSDCNRSPRNNPCLEQGKIMWMRHACNKYVQQGNCCDVDERKLA